jgi:hypothetical protein
MRGFAPLMNQLSRIAGLTNGLCVQEHIEAASILWAKVDLFGLPVLASAHTAAVPHKVHRKTLLQLFVKLGSVLLGSEDSLDFAQIETMVVFGRIVFLDKIRKKMIGLEIIEVHLGAFDDQIGFLKCR